MAKGPVLFLSLLADTVIRKNFEAISNYLRGNTLEGFKAYEIVFSGEISQYHFRHGLGFVPKDVILSRIFGSGNVTFHHADFTRDEIVLSASAACEIRFLLGTAQNG